MCGTIQNYNGNKKQKNDNALKRGVLYIKWKNSWCVHCLEMTNIKQIQKDENTNMENKMEIFTFYFFITENIRMLFKKEKSYVKYREMC